MRKGERRPEPVREDVKREFRSALDWANREEVMEVAVVILCRDAVL